jgi:hypothetical protein
MSDLIERSILVSKSLFRQEHRNILSLKKMKQERLSHLPKLSSFVTVVLAKG